MGGKKLIGDRGERKKYISQRVYRFMHLQSAPSFGIFHPSIEEAAELIAVDMFFNGLYPKKEPKNFDGDPQNPTLIKSLDKEIEEFKSRLISAIEKGQIKANPTNRNLDDKLIPEISHINIGDLRIWLSERGYNFGDIYREYSEAELAVLERVCDEVILMRTYKNRHDGEEINDLIKSIINDSKLKDPRVVELIGRYKYEVAQNSELRNKIRMPEPAKVDRPITTRARRTMLTIIAALCKKAEIDYQERGAATEIKKATERIKAPVDDETIRKLLDEIEDAVDSRMKDSAGLERMD
jgi:hypothetical protein